MTDPAWSGIWALAQLGRRHRAAVCMVALALGVSTAAARGSEVELVRVPAGDQSVKVRWVAEVEDADGEFRVLSGADFGSLRVVARIAVDQSGTYEALDLAAPYGSRVFQLQYVDSRGRLVVLATQRILIESELRSADLWTAGLSQLDVATLQTGATPGHGGSGSPALPGSVREESLAPRPPTPPPEGFGGYGSQSRA